MVSEWGFYVIGYQQVYVGYVEDMMGCRGYHGMLYVYIDFQQVLKGPYKGLCQDYLSSYTYTVHFFFFYEERALAVFSCF